MAAPGGTSPGTAPPQPPLLRPEQVCEGARARRAAPPFHPPPPAPLPRAAALTAALTRRHHAPQTRAVHRVRYGPEGTGPESEGVGGRGRARTRGGKEAPAQRSARRETADPSEKDPSEWLGPAADVYHLMVRYSTLMVSLHGEHAGPQ